MLTAAVVAVLAVTLLVGWLWYVTTEPRFGAAAAQRVEVTIDAARLEVHVRTLAEIPRDFSNIPGLAQAAQYIAQSLEAAGGMVALQPYPVGATTYYNVTAQFGPDTEQRIVVGAHYDTAGPLPGADDNASGIAGLIELARALDPAALPMRVELVAYCLEEPPYFRTPQMGSAVHARSLAEAGVEVKLMVSLEMLGFYSDEPDSQSYPASFLKLLYPTVGNFITVVSTYGQDGLGGRFRDAINAASEVPAYTITASRRLEGIDYSDHLNYWDAGFPALMLTDTSFYRNANYHTEGDTPDTLDYQRMAQVVRGALNAVLILASE